MNDRLPPLTALRAFDAAARHMSFALAAAELNVTPAALSFQIKSLEAHLGQPVFRRLNRAVELTEAGRMLMPGVADGFSALSAAWRNTQRSFDNNILNVTAGPAFTSKWLAPRLYEFAQAHPETELRFSASLRLMDFDRDEVDVAIRFGVSNDEGLFSEPLVQEWLTPMMSPELAQKYDTPEKLSDAVLIHDDSIAFLDHPVNWATWAQAAGMNFDTGSGPRFSQADHALDAAISGAGVTLGRISLTSRALEVGNLVAPYDIGVWSQGQFRVICPKGTQDRPHVAAFRKWVFHEMQGVSAFADGRTIVDPLR